MLEEPLAGGNASGAVIRVGQTVRKPWQESTQAVHALLSCIRQAGIDGPEPIGRDEQGRQILEYIDGVPAIDLPPLGLDELQRVGNLIRRIHDVSAAVVDPTPDAWGDVLLPVEGADLICHNDLAPWNLIIGDRSVFIDWDGAGPSTRLWDLAYSAQTFANLVAGEPVDAAALRLRAVVDGYGADGELRGALPSALSRRTAAMHEMLKTASVTGRQPWARVFREDGEHWRGATEYIAAHEAVWRDALT